MNKPINPWKLTGYKAGQNVACQIVSQEPGGYSVLIPKDNLPGFLPTEQKLRVGEEILAQFVCVHNNRILLSSRFSGTAAPAAPAAATTAASWEAQARGEADAAFEVWAETTPRKFQLKRATDLIVPPINGESPNAFKIGDYDLEWLITDLEGGMRTCVVKASSEERLSRSAMLLYRGRAVGCIYGCKTMTDTQPTEQSLALMMQDLRLAETQVLIYDLPEEVILAMSALFFGVPVPREDDLDARSYTDYISGWFTEKGQTACLAITLPSTSGTCLGMFHRGQYIGSFYVEDQKFNTDRNFLYELFAREPQAGVEASILPPEMTSPAVRFGFSLSMALHRQQGV